MARLRCLTLIGLLFLFTACGGDEEPLETPTTVGQEQAQPAVGSTAQPLGATPFANVPITSSPVPTPLRQVKGLFNDPRSTTPSQRISLGAPVSPFTPPDGRTVIVYDLATGKEQRFEPGYAGSFAGDYFTYWADSQEGWLVNLRTGERRSLGKTTGAPGFADDNTVLLKQDTIFDVPTGQTVAVADLPAQRRGEIERFLQGTGTYSGDVRLKDGSIWHATQAIRLSQCDKGSTLSAYAVCGARERQDLMLVNDQGRVLYHFRAGLVYPSFDSELMLFTPGVCEDGGKVVDCLDLAERTASPSPYSSDWKLIEGTTNLFSLDLETGQATFIATSRYVLNTRNMSSLANLVADDRYVIWTEGFCYENGVTRVYDRRTKRITEIDEAMVMQFAAGKLRAGPYYPLWLLEPGTWRRVATLPTENGTQYHWSKDNRYVAAGTILGKGGPCI
jgi:hypothetical protein